jgi:GNAT superfamily N-acetyltransferase
MVARRATWRVRPYAPGDETGILALCAKIFDSTSTLEEWRWRNLENPAGKAIVLVAEQKDSGKIIGHAAAFPIDFKVGDFGKKGFFVVDSAVDQTHRGKGMTTLLTLEISKEACKEDGGFGCGLPNEQAYLPTLKTGAIKLFTMSLFLKVLDWRGVLRRLRPAFLASAVGGLAQLLQRQRQNTNANGFRIEQVSWFGDEANDLWRRIASRFAIVAVRNATVLNWRYLQRPDSRHRVFSISNNGQWQGYVVIRTLEKWGLRLGTLIDLVFDPDCPQGAQLLLCQAEAQLLAEGAEVLWGLFSSPKSYRKFLRKAGFFSIPQWIGVRQFHFVADFVTIKHFRPDLAARDDALLRQADQWFLALGDTDLV